MIFGYAVVKLLSHPFKFGKSGLQFRASKLVTRVVFQRHHGGARRVVPNRRKSFWHAKK
jgi:hypothetical protein